MKPFSCPFTSAVAALLLVTLPWVTHAADQNQAVVDFKSLDTNRDGKVSLNEATEHDGLFVAFKNLDKDKDGALTKEEFDAYRMQR